MSEPTQDNLGESGEERTPLSIVSIDDDGDFREYLATILEPLGYEVRTAGTPEEFFDLCEDRLPDVALVDMNMGEHSGSALLDDVRARWPKLCVVIVTGYPTLDSMRQTFKQRVFDYIAKPFGTEELLRVLEQAAEAHGLGRRPQDLLRTELGRRIRLARTERGWTLKDLSEASGVSVSQLSSIERGAHLPSLESLLTVAQALDQRPSVWLAEAGF